MIEVRFKDNLSLRDYLYISTGTFAFESAAIALSSRLSEIGVQLFLWIAVVGGFSLISAGIIKMPKRR